MMRKKIYGKDHMYNGHPNTIPPIIKRNNKHCRDSFSCRGEVEFNRIVELKKAVFRLFKSCIISKEFFLSKVTFFDNFFTCSIFNILNHFNGTLNYCCYIINDYPIPINNQSIINFQYKKRIILA